jgi:valyl-tRNA synthetase
VENALGSYRINEYSKLIYDFVWRDFCDWYVELLKTELMHGADAARSEGMLRFALGIYDQILRMLHPIMPFVTEEIWQTITERSEGASVAVERFPAPDPHLVSANIERDFALMQEVVEAIRRMRNQANVPPSRQLDVNIAAEDAASSDILHRTADLMKRLARIESLEISADAAKPQLSATEVVREVEVHLLLEGLIDVDKERQKTEKEIGRLEGQLKGIRGKLANDKFVSNAPDDVVEREREKLRSFEETLVKLRETLKIYEAS